MPPRRPVPPLRRAYSAYSACGPTKTASMVGRRPLDDFGLSPEGPQRVYPASSIVQSSARASYAGSEAGAASLKDVSNVHDSSSSADIVNSGTIPRVPPRAAAVSSVEGSKDDGSCPPSPDADPFITTRFTHILTDEGHALITGCNGTLQRCEDEPIHIPGAIQAFGVLVALRKVNGHGYQVRYASENVKRLLGYDPHELFRLSNFTDIFSEEQAQHFCEHIEIVNDESNDPSVLGPSVFALTHRTKGPLGGRKTLKMWCSMHAVASQLIICEFELESDPEFPLIPINDEFSEPFDSLHANPTAEELAESSELLSRPLRRTRFAQLRTTALGSMQVLDLMSQVQDQLSTATDLKDFLKILIGVVRDMTGFHRVMIYQFDSNFNGKVIAELVDTSKTLDLYQGLHFPASDIPRQARDLYRINKVRLLYDRDLETTRIVCRTQADLDNPLDMTHCYSRAMSPIHLKYLGNMGVRSSMSLSLKAFGELWGLISLHSYGPHGMRVAPSIRKMCRLIADIASTSIERLSYAMRFQTRKLLNAAVVDSNSSPYLMASSDDLIQLFDADFGMVAIQGETKLLGKVHDIQEGLAILEFLKSRNLTSVYATEQISRDFPDFEYPREISKFPGFLYVPLSTAGTDFIVFFRQGVLKEVKWAGNPYDKQFKKGTSALLEPRSSFNTWIEQVMEQSKPWTPDQLEIAGILCLVYGKFIKVWRQKEAVVHTSRLTQLLLANSAHEVRTPLNAIVNYLEIALEGALDEETRSNLTRSYTASKSLIYVINDLLDLTKMEQGNALTTDQSFDLRQCLEDATSPFLAEAERRHIHFAVMGCEGLDVQVLGDSRRIRQVISHVVSNAFQNTKEGHVKVEASIFNVSESLIRAEFSAEDTGVGFSCSELDILFRDLEQVDAIDDEHEHPENSSTLGHTPDQESIPSTSQEVVKYSTTSASAIRAPNRRKLGIGLAFVARIIKIMDGQLRVKSEPGTGTRVVIQLTFQLPPSKTAASDSDKRAGAQHLSKWVSQEDTVTMEGNTTDEKGETLSAIEAGSSVKTSTTTRTTTTPRQLPYIIHRSKSFHQQESMDCFNSVSPGSQQGQVVLVDGRRSSNVELTSGDERHENEFPQVLPPSEQLQQQKRQEAHEHTQTMLNDRSKDSAKSGLYHPIRSKAQKETTSSTKLNILLAEDDPINASILSKRLRTAGHTVSHVLDGQKCLSAYKTDPEEFDVILMDVQMPIIDGITSTSLIREFEKSYSSPLSSHDIRRIPIIAVSAGLMEESRSMYIEKGLDGWMLKPINFKRMTELLAGITDDATRVKCVYSPGNWEAGGWFTCPPQATRDTCHDTPESKKKAT